MSKNKKIGVIGFNLGGPDRLESVKPFLFNLFYDPLIIRAPKPIRYFLAKFISSNREKKAQHIYSLIGGKSPILENTNKQMQGLEKNLRAKGYKNIRCITAMRYWHPMVPEIVDQVKKERLDEVILLPLYPQYSSTTSQSFFRVWDQVAKQKKLEVKTSYLCCYPENTGFIKESAERIYKALKKNPDGRVLFSAHGLPEKIVKQRDPYPLQCQKSAEAVIKCLKDEFGVKKLDWVLCFQSRVGPLKWIGPATEAEIERAGRDQKGIIIYPIAFVSEHSETLVEIDMEYRDLATEKKVPFFEFVKTVADHPQFIEGLSEIVLKRIEDGVEIGDEFGAQYCPCGYTACAGVLKGRW